MDDLERAEQDLTDTLAEAEQAMGELNQAIAADPDPDRHRERMAERSRAAYCQVAEIADIPPFTAEELQVAAPVDPAAAERWRVACHECGHALCAFAHTGKPVGATINPLGGGFAHFFDLNLPDFTEGIALAAGAAAEVLAERVSPPAMTEEAEIRLDLQQVSAKAAIAIDSHNPLPARPAINDTILLAHWAIRNREGRHNDWAPLIVRAHAQAKNFVTDNAGAIVAMARRLFQQGSIGPEDYEALGLTTDLPASPAQEPESRQGVDHG